MNDSISLTYGNVLNIISSVPSLTYDRCNTYFISENFIIWNCAFIASKYSPNNTFHICPRMQFLVNGCFAFIQTNGTSSSPKIMWGLVDQ